MKIIISLLFLLLSLGLQAQESPGLRNIIVDSASYVPMQRYSSIGFSYRTTRDRALSPLIFQGIGLSYSSYSWKYNGRWLWQQGITTQSHVLQKEPGTSILSEVGLSYQVSALRELRELQQGKWRFWLGPEAMMFLNTRLHSRNVNNIASYDWVTTLGLAGMVSNKFKLWGRTFALSNQLQLPLLYLYARPPYAWGVPPAIFEEQKGSWKEAFQLGTLNNIVLVSNQLNLDFYLPKKKKKETLKYHAFRISYAWDFFQVKTRNSLQTGGHQLSISKVISF